MYSVLLSIRVSIEAKLSTVYIFLELFHFKKTPSQGDCFTPPNFKTLHLQNGTIPRGKIARVRKQATIEWKLKSCKFSFLKSLVCLLQIQYTIVHDKIVEMRHIPSINYPCVNICVRNFLAVDTHVTRFCTSFLYAFAQKHPHSKQNPLHYHTSQLGIIS